MAGKKFRKDKNEIRYHRIDLGQDDCLDDEELKLDRDLGPPKKRRNCGKITRNCFIVCTVLLTLAGLVSVVAYTAIIFPEGPTKQLSILYKKVFGKEETNSTLLATNSNFTVVENTTLSSYTLADENTTNESVAHLSNATGDTSIKNDADISIDKFVGTWKYSVGESSALFKCSRISDRRLACFEYLGVDFVPENVAFNLIWDGDVTFTDEQNGQVGQFDGEKTVTFSDELKLVKQDNIEDIEKAKKSGGGTTVRRKRRLDIPSPGSNYVKLKFPDELKYAGNQEDAKEYLPKPANNFVTFSREKRNKRTAKNKEDNTILSHESGNLESKYVPNLENTRVKQSVNPEENEYKVNPEEYVEYNIEDIQNEIVQSLRKFERDQGLKINVTANEENFKNQNSTESTTQKDAAITPELNHDGTEREPWHLDDLTETLYRHNDNNEVTIGFSVFLLIAGATILCCCIYCRHKRRKAAKRRHFSRLVNDLNASEKFTLVTPSDDESD